MAEDVSNVNPATQSVENKLVNKGLSKLPAPNVTGMTLGADVRIGNLTLNTIDPNGVVWVCTDIIGWWTTPDPELPDLPRGWGDGSYDSRGRYTARNLTLNGVFLTQDPSQVAVARKTLIEAIDLVYDGGDLVVSETSDLQITSVDYNNDKLTIPNHGLKVGDVRTYRTTGLTITGLIKDTPYYVKTVVDANNIKLSLTSGGAVVDLGTASQDTNSVVESPLGVHQLASPSIKTSFVRLNGRPEIATINARGRTEFSVGLKAPDPIKYEYLTTGTNIEDGYRTKAITTATPVNNSGNTKTPIIIELTGPVPEGATVANAINYLDAGKDDVTETITLVKAVPSGSTLEIDTLNREALLVTSGETENGRSYISTLSSWFYIQPDAKAENSLTFTSATGSCKVFYRSGWIG